MQYTEIFSLVKIEYCFAQNIDCGYMVGPHRQGGLVVLTSTHNLLDQK